MRYLGVKIRRSEKISFYRVQTLRDLLLELLSLCEQSEIVINRIIACVLYEGTIDRLQYQNFSQFCIFNFSVLQRANRSAWKKRILITRVSSVVLIWKTQ